MAADLILLALGWLFWCSLHSLLITPPVTRIARKLLGSRYAWFRLGYNLLAIVTIVPLVGWTLFLSTPTVLDWRWPWSLLQAFMVVSGLGLFYAGAQAYPMEEFLGLRQVRRYRQGGGEGRPSRLKTDGVLGLVRHPWYLAAFLLLWGRDLQLDDLVTSVILSAYLGVGAVLEERKLLLEYGERYRRYQQRVSMFFPWNWLKEKLGR